MCKTTNFDRLPFSLYKARKIRRSCKSYVHCYTHRAENIGFSALWLYQGARQDNNLARKDPYNDFI